MNKPDWKYWPGEARVDLWQAIALSLDVDPEELSRLYNHRFHVPIDHDIDSEFQARLTRIADDTPIASHPLVRHNRRLLYSQPIRLGEMARYVCEIYGGWPIPEAFRSLGNSDCDTHVDTQPAIAGTQVKKIKRAALITKYRNEWPTAERDLGEGSRNGLGEAKAGKGYYDEERSVEWARSAGKFKDMTMPKPTMANLPGRVIKQQD